MKKSLLIGIAAIMASVTGFSQKFGHINGERLVKHMPEYAVAKMQIDTLILQYENVLKEMKSEYDALVEKIKAQQNSNPATPKTLIEKNLMKLQSMEQEMYEINETMNEDVQQQQLEKLDPIQRKALEAVEAVGKEKGFTYIFDTSTGVLLFVDGGIDITPFVCAKLGIPDYSPEEKEEIEKMKKGIKDKGTAPAAPEVPKK